MLVFSRALSMPLFLLLHWMQGNILLTSLLNYLNIIERWEKFPGQQTVQRYYVGICNNDSLFFQVLQGRYLGEPPSIFCLCSSSSTVYDCFQTSNKAEIRLLHAGVIAGVLIRNWKLMGTTKQLLEQEEKVISIAVV